MFKMARLIWALSLLLFVPFALAGQGDGNTGIVVNAKYNSLYTPDPFDMIVRAHSKWNSTRTPGLRALAAEKLKIGNVTAATVSSDREYLAQVAFGTPPQWLPMDLDTGSSDVWVFSAALPAKDTANRTVYNPANSSTATVVTNSTWTITYGDGTSAYGLVYQDTVNIAGIKIEKANVESATSVSSDMSSDNFLSGVFGLAYDMPPDITPSQPSLLSQLLPLLDTPVFTVDLKYMADGEYEFGYIDDTKYTSDIRYVPLNKDQYWSVNFTLAMVGGSSTWLTSRNAWTGIVDTGTTLMMMPEEVVNRYYAGVPGAEEWWMGWVYDCGATLPDFHIGFDDHDYAKFVIPGQYLSFHENLNDPSIQTCMGGLQSDTGIGFSILGDVFLKAVFAVFDVDKGRVGFAPKALNNLNSTII